MKPIYARLHSVSRLSTQLFSPCIHTVDAYTSDNLNVDATTVSGRLGPHALAWLFLIIIILHAYFGAS